MATSSKTCRPARMSDHATIVQFQIAMALETERMALDPEVCARGVRAVLEDPGKGAYYVCDDGGRVTACLMIIPEWSDWRDGAVWWIHSVYVLPEARKAGAFREMFAFIKSKVEGDPRLRGLRLFVDRTNTGAQAVYRKLGMSDEHYAMFEWMKG